MPMPKSAPAQPPLFRCPVSDACADKGRPPWCKAGEWRRLYPTCAREQAGTAADCPHVECVRKWLEKQGKESSADGR